jgi:hypothetical protein
VDPRIAGAGSSSDGVPEPRTKSALSGTLSYGGGPRLSGSPASAAATAPLPSPLSPSRSRAPASTRWTSVSGKPAAATGISVF